MDDSCNNFIRDKFELSLDRYTNDEIALAKKIHHRLDFRYDSFFATLLKRDGASLVLPEGINIISWNYDFQFEISYSNYSNSTLHKTEKDLNIFGALNERKFDVSKPGIIKLNGTAGFVGKENNFGLFDVKEHKLDSQSMNLLIKELCQNHSESIPAIRFAWTDDKLAKEAVYYSKEILQKSKVIVIIGYSFPYFNREIDREIFSGLKKIRQPKIYLQVPENSFQSISDRFKGVHPDIPLTPYTETDQFLIPNELE